MSESSYVQIVRTACMMCHGGCGIRVHLKDGKAIKIEGDKDCPNNRGNLCPKGKAPHTRQNARAICILQAITGNLDLPGCFKPDPVPEEIIR